MFKQRLIWKTKSCYRKTIKDLESRLRKAALEAAQQGKCSCEVNVTYAAKDCSSYRALVFDYLVYKYHRKGYEIEWQVIERPYSRNSCQIKFTLGWLDLYLRR